MEPSKDERCAGLEVRLVRLEEKHEAMIAQIIAARKDLDRRMEELNDVRNRFLPREVFDREHNGLIARIADLERARASATGQLVAYASVIAFIMAAAGILIHFWK